MASSNKTIRFTIKTITEGGKEVNALKVNLKDLEEMISFTQRRASKGISLGVKAVGFDAITNMIGKLDSVLQDMTSAYQAQEVNEMRLATAMRNTMDATDEEIQSVKDLCSALQEKGVIGDEVQLQGAQELATYLDTTDALKKLIPVMNDMTVQQYGLGASGENAASIAAMLGKVMEGQTKALSRLGYYFDEAEETILKFGNEEERAATLAEVVTRAVGGMNEEAAKTDSGKMQQLKNTIGDIKEEIGKATASFTPYLQLLNQGVIAYMNVSTGIKTYIGWIKSLSVTQKSATVTTRVFTMALRGLMITSGIGIAIAALTFLIDKLAGSVDKASDSIGKLSDAEEEASRKGKSLGQIHSEAESRSKTASKALEINIRRLEEFNGTKEEEKKLVKEMNELYGESMGYFSSVSSWYKALTANSEEYCRQLVNQTKLESLRNNIAKMEEQRDEINGKLQRGEFDETRKINSNSMGKVWTEKSEKDRALEDWMNLEGRIEAGYEMMAELQSESFSFKIKGSADPNIIDPDKLKREQERIAKEQERIERERQKAKEDADKKVLALQQKTETDYIDLMEDGEEKERALINHAYSSKMAEIAEKEKELTELRIKEGKEGLDESEKELLKFARDLAQQTRDKSLKELTPLGAGAIRTYDELSKALSHWNDRFNRASEDERGQIRKTIQELERLKDSFDLDADLFSRSAELDKLRDFTGKQHKIEIEAVGLDGWLDRMNDMQRIMNDTSATDKQKEAAKELAEEYRKLASESVSYMDVISSGWGDIKGIGNNIKSLTDALNGQKDAWETLVAIIDSSLGVYQSVMQVIDMMNTLSEIFTFNKTAEAVATKMATQATVEGAEEQVAATGAVVAANSAQTTSEVEKASAETFSAHASIPWVGIAIAGGMVAAMLATMLTLPKFAEGGIVSGPTIGLMGEYAGASSNPEVIAPLDKLQSMLGETGPGTVRVVGETKITHKDLLIVLRNATQISSKSGKRTGIKI